MDHWIAAAVPAQRTTAAPAMKLCAVVAGCNVLGFASGIGIALAGLYLGVGVDKR